MAPLIWTPKTIFGCVACSGLAQEELEPLSLVHSQRTAALQILVSLKRLRLAMRGAQRTYVLAA